MHSRTLASQLRTRHPVCSIRPSSQTRSRPCVKRPATPFVNHHARPGIAGSGVGLDIPSEARGQRQIRSYGRGLPVLQCCLPGTLKTMGDTACARPLSSWNYVDRGGAE